MKILHLEFEQYPKAAIDLLQSHATVVASQIQTYAELHQLLSIEQFDVIFTRLGIYIDAELMNLQKKLTCIVTSTTGLNHIDLSAANDKNIDVISLKGETEFLATIKSTAEHTWMLLLSLIRKLIPAYENVIEKQEWMRTPFLADELDGKTIGIIGFGRLGKIVSRYAEAFGMNVLVNDRLKIETDSPYQQVDIKTLVSTSDFIVLLISYDNENIKFFDKEKFGWMKSTAYFINTSRGEMVDENALVSALNNKQIKGAALDVLDGDSAWESQYNGNQALLEYARNNDHLIVTPHMGGYGKESIARTRQFVTEKFIRKYSHQQ